MKKLICLKLFFLCFNSAALAGGSSYDELNKFMSPVIQGDVLLIQGRIDSHIYDFLAREAEALKSVQVIELNSFGGNTDWALEIGRKIKELNKITRLSTGHVCASACVYLFGAGRERWADGNTWLGIHGARLGAGYTTTFQGLCFFDLESGSIFAPNKKGCQDFLAEWHSVALAATNASFALMESCGVSPSLRETYFGLPDDSDWPASFNVLRKPDWVLNAQDAFAFDLVTEIKN